MNRWLLAAPLVVFGIGGIGLYALFMSQADDNAFRENLLPELIGFCLEGFFLVGLFTFVQQLRDYYRRRELWLSLRSALRDFLSHLDLAFLGPEREPATSRDLESQPLVVRRLTSLLDKAELGIGTLVSLKHVAISTLPLARDLINIAAQLSTRHMRCWIAIVESIDQLTEADTREQVERPLNELLMRLTEFDNLKL
ncbi:MAG: hypothetical protein ACI8RN_000046 [Glaciecola sp.]|uniref:hypothetical protein n=1 Tax=Congregibacter sp. TaxID=2744308 RepID=UPI0039E4A55B